MQPLSAKDNAMMSIIGLYADSLAQCRLVTASRPQCSEDDGRNIAPQAALTVWQSGHSLYFRNPA